MSLIAEIASAFVSLIPSLRGAKGIIQKELDGEMQSAGKSGGGKFSGALGGVLKKGSLAVGVAAGGILGAALFKGFERLSAIDQAKAKLTGLGNSTKAVNTIMTNALASVKGTAFGLGDAATVAATAVAAGIKPGRELEGTLKLVADAATIGGTSLGEMGQIFSKVATSNKLQGDTINQLNERGIPIVQLLAKQLGVSSGEVVKLASAGKIGFADFQKAMETGLGGSALKSGETFKGALANVGAALGRVGAALLTGLFPIAKQVFGSLITSLDGLTAKVGPVADAFAAKLPGAFAAAKPALANIGAALANVGTIISTVVIPGFISMGKAVVAVVKFFTEHSTAAKALGVAVGGVLAFMTAAWIAQGVVATVSAAKSVVAWFATATAATTSATIHSRSTAQIVVGWIAAGAAAIASGAQTVYVWALYKIEAIKGAAAHALAAARVAAGWVLMGAKALLGAAKMAAAWLIALGPIGLAIAAIAAVVAVVILNWDKIKAATVAVWGAIKTTVSTAVSGVVNFVKAHWPLLLAIIAGPIGLAVALVIKHWSRIKASTSAAFNFVRSAVSSAVNAARSAVSSAVGGIVSIFRGLLGRIRGALSGAGGALVGVGRNIVNGLISGIRSMGGAIGRALVALLPGPLKRFAGALGIDSPSKVFEGFGANIGEGLVQGVDKSRSDVTAASTRLAASVATPKGARFDAKASGTGRQGASAAPVDLIDYARLAQEFAKITIRNNLSIGKRDAATLVTVGTSAVGALR